MRRTAKILALIAALVPASLAIPAGAAHAAVSACAAANLHPALLPSTQARHTTLCLLNRERRRHGLRPLRLNRKLSVASLRHSRNMVRRDFFAHGNFVARIVNAHYVGRSGAWTLGENIAWGTGYLATPREIVKGWMNSSGHRHNILSPRFRDIGIGIATGAPGAARSAAAGATYTTDFGRRG
ncbi:MAG: hypothetical protein QOE65_711 [Solirubrobacteraceae bacterium]|jgi:uncharacterized protein YkwD|nr:hypothetical protein [Solirubrobacteraceae bacterium]